MPFHGPHPQTKQLGRWEWEYDNPWGNSKGLGTQAGWWVLQGGKELGPVVSWIWDFSNHPHTSTQPSLALVLKQEEKGEEARAAFKARASLLSTSVARRKGCAAARVHRVGRQDSV